MSPHLTPVELVSVADGQGSDELRRHVETCADCRAKLEVIRAVETDLRTGRDVPEPSPLFWDHFSERVRQATADEPVPASAWWSGRWVALLAAGAAVAIMAVMLSTRMPDGRTVPSMTDGATAASGSPLPVAGTDESRWDDVVQLAAQLSTDDVTGLASVTDSTSLIDDLTSDERRTLLRLLAAETKDTE